MLAPLVSSLELWLYSIVSCFFLFLKFLCLFHQASKSWLNIFDFYHLCLNLLATWNTSFQMDELSRAGLRWLQDLLSAESVTMSCCQRAPHDRSRARAGSHTRAAGGKLRHRGSGWGDSLQGSRRSSGCHPVPLHLSKEDWSKVLGRGRGFWAGWALG